MQIKHQMGQKLNKIFEPIPLIWVSLPKYFLYIEVTGNTYYIIKIKKIKINATA